MAAQTELGTIQAVEDDTAPLLTATRTSGRSALWRLAAIIAIPAAIVLFANNAAGAAASAPAAVLKVIALSFVFVGVGLGVPWLVLRRLKHRAERLRYQAQLAQLHAPTAERAQARLARTEREQLATLLLRLEGEAFDELVASELQEKTVAVNQAVKSLAGFLMYEELRQRGRTRSDIENFKEDAWGRHMAQSMGKLAPLDRATQRGLRLEAPHVVKQWGAPSVRLPGCSDTWTIYFVREGVQLANITGDFDPQRATQQWLAGTIQHEDSEGNW